MEPARWEHFPHEADVGVRGFGPTLSAAFEQAALALTAVVTDPELVEPGEEIFVQCEAPDAELLLVEWLSALVYEMSTGSKLFGSFDVRIEGNRLAGRARGEPVDVARHRPMVEVKGVTYTALTVHCEADGTWSAACVVDV